MKSILITLVLGVSIVSWGQSSVKEIDTVIYNGNQKTIKYTDGSQSITVSNKNAVAGNNLHSVKKKFKSIQDEMAYLNKYISQLEIKKEHIKKNPSEDQLAKENGWYDQINKYISESKARLKELDELLKQKGK